MGGVIEWESSRGDNLKQRKPVPRRRRRGAARSRGEQFTHAQDEGDLRADALLGRWRHTWGSPRGREFQRGDNADRAARARRRAPARSRH